MFRVLCVFAVRTRFPHVLRSFFGVPTTLHMTHGKAIKAKNIILRKTSPDLTTPLCREVVCYDY